MFFGATPFGDATFAGLSGTDASVPVLFTYLLEDTQAELVFVLIATPKSVDEAYAVTSQTVYLSDRGFNTLPTDSPANQIFLPRLLNPYNFETTIPYSGMMGRGTSAFGSIEIANADGELDELLDYAWAGEDIEVKMGGRYNIGRSGESVLAYSSFGRLFLGTAAGVSASRETISISLRDPAQRLAVPIQSNLYAGTGGAEGGSDLFGRPKPLAYGAVSNVPAVLIDSAYLVYQVHDGAIEGFVAVRDSGAPLTFSADYASYAALVAASISTGFYATCLAEGMLRLGAQSNGLLTCDVEGDSSNDGAYDGYALTTAQIVQRVTIVHGATPLSYPADFETSALANLNTDATGIWIGTEARTIDNVLDELLGSVGGWWMFTRDALLSVGVLEEPIESDDTVDMADESSSGIRRMAAPEPIWRVTLGYKKFYALQEPSSLAGSVSAADADSYSKEYRYVTASNSAIQTAYPLARDITVLTTLDDVTQAQAECDRLLALHGVRRKVWQITEVLDNFQYRIGQSITLENDRFGMSAGDDYVLVGLVENAASRTADLTLWG